MPELQIGKYGQIQEWSEDYDEVEPGHRHISLTVCIISCRTDTYG